MRQVVKEIHTTVVRLAVVVVVLQCSPFKTLTLTSAHESSDVCRSTSLTVPYSSNMTRPGPVNSESTGQSTIRETGCVDRMVHLLRIMYKKNHVCIVVGYNNKHNRTSLSPAPIQIKKGLFANS